MGTLGTIIISVVCATAVIFSFLAGFFYAFYWLDKKILQGELSDVIKRYSDSVHK